ncbi:unnamed protein product, partial [Mesorhabditis belari]|uniref:Uncharacterized protein n=1 Tax=Mesorhabditis belari TaxID=2138241 RepID=A0AAF3EJH3_9BILA
MDFDDIDCNNGCEYCGRMKQSGRFYTFEAYGCGCGDDSIFGPDDDNERMLMIARISSRKTPPPTASICDKFAVKRSSVHRIFIK